MKKNPVELLAVINPQESGWTKERWRNFVLGSVVAGVGFGLYRDRTARARTGAEARRASSMFWVFGLGTVVGAYLLFGDKFKKQGLQRNRRSLRLDDLSFESTVGCDVEGYDAYAGGDLIGEIAAYEDEDGYHYRLADEWAWSPADDLDEAKRGLVGEYNLEMAEEKLESNPQQKYFVRIPKEGVTYPKSGSDSYPGGYSLRKAQDFARIGSQTGSPREVRRGRRGGPRVRSYIKGKRTWPVSRGQAKSLLPAEVPKRLRAS